MGDGVKIDDAGEELPLPVGVRGPAGNLSQGFCITSTPIIEARSVDQCDYCLWILKSVRLNLVSTFRLSAFDSNFYNRDCPTRIKVTAHLDLRIAWDLRNSFYLRLSLILANVCRFRIIAGSPPFSLSLIVGKSKCDAQASVTRQLFYLFHGVGLYNTSLQQHIPLP